MSKKGKTSKNDFLNILEDSEDSSKVKTKLRTKCRQT